MNGLDWLALSREVRNRSVETDDGGLSMYGLILMTFKRRP